MNKRQSQKPAALVLLIAAQVLCTGVFLLDALGDGMELGFRAFTDWKYVIELIAVLALISAIVIETRFLMTLLRRSAHLERQVSVAATAFHEVIEDHFRNWKLTPSEQDVAHFLVKGFSNSEIAALRGSAEGTVKSHLNAIYRKAGVTNRGELLSLLIDDLMGRDMPAPLSQSPGLAAQ